LRLSCEDHNAVNRVMDGSRIAHCGGCGACWKTRDYPDFVEDVPLDEAGLLELAAKLKARCGTGGTVKDGVIEIQGDQRNRPAVVLEGMGYRVKRVGG
jgi:hypothetical protein